MIDIVVNLALGVIAIALIGIAACIACTGFLLVADMFGWGESDCDCDECQAWRDTQC